MDNIRNVVAGDPSPDRTPALVEALVRGGADLIELGVPFSDPLADGPVIQASSQQALERGMTYDGVLAIIEKAKLHVPVVLFSYLNPILAAGPDAAELGAPVPADLGKEPADRRRLGRVQHVAGGRGGRERNSRHRYSSGRRSSARGVAGQQPPRFHQARRADDSAGSNGRDRAARQRIRLSYQPARCHRCPGNHRDVVT